MPTPIKVAARVVDITVHTDELRTYVLAPARPVPTFLPGQFLHLALDPFEAGMHWPDSRVYSIASSPSDRDRIRITVSRQGSFTSRLFAELQLGSEVWIKLPYGSFCPNPDLPGRMVMLAGGSGITPFMSFIEWATINRPATAIDLHYGARSSTQLVYLESIERCRNEGLVNLRVRYYVEHPSLPERASLADLLTVGRLSPELAWNWLDSPEAAHFYLSGPKAMIGTFREALLGLGATKAAVLSDDWA